jgi:hypothetical protein
MLCCAVLCLLYQYIYGIDEYPFILSEVIVFEVLLVIVFAVLLGRQIYHLHHVVNGAYELIRSKASGKVAPVLTPGGGAAAAAADEAALSIAEGREGEEEEGVGWDMDDSPDADVVTSFKEATPAPAPSASAVPGPPPRDPFSPDSADLRKAILAHRRTDVQLRDAISQIRMSHTVSWYDVLDWALVLIIGTAIGVRVSYITACREFQQYVTNQRDGFEDIFEGIVQRAVAVEQPEYVLRIVLFLAVFFGMLQFFRYMSFDARLRTVTTTMLVAARDLVPVLMLFVLTLLSFAILGSQVYGQTLDDFSTLKDSLDSLFLMILGDFTSYYKSTIPVSLYHLI